MRRGESFSIALGAMLLTAAVAVIAAMHLPVMEISAVESRGLPMTPSMARIAQKAIGSCYPSIDRRGIVEDIEALPYISSAYLSYKDGSLLLSVEPESGAALVFPDSAAFTDGKAFSSMAIEDAGALLGVYPLIASKEGNLDGAFSDFMATAVPLLLEQESVPSLISWIEYCNINDDGHAVLRSVIPELNAVITVESPEAVGRIDDCIGIIRDENRLSPMRTVLSPPSEYGLHSDRLMRIKG